MPLNCAFSTWIAATVLLQTGLQQNQNADRADLSHAVLSLCWWTGEIQHWKWWGLQKNLQKGKFTHTVAFGYTKIMNQSKTTCIAFFSDGCKKIIFSSLKLFFPLSRKVTATMIYFCHFKNRLLTFYLKWLHPAIWKLHFLEIHWLLSKGYFPAL